MFIPLFVRWRGAFKIWKAALVSQHLRRTKATIASFLFDKDALREELRLARAHQAGAGADAFLDSGPGVLVLNGEGEAELRAGLGLERHVFQRQGDLRSAGHANRHAGKCAILPNRTVRLLHF